MNLHHKLVFDLSFVDAIYKIQTQNYSIKPNLVCVFFQRMRYKPYILKVTNKISIAVFINDTVLHFLLKSVHIETMHDELRGLNYVTPRNY
jgi:hypothetical protein